MRHTDRALFRSACRLQVHSTVGSCRCSHPVQSRDGRAWRTADIRSIASGQGSCGTRRGNVPGQARNRTTACGRNHHRRCEPRAGGLPSTLQRPLQGACAGVGSRLSCRKRGDVAWRGSCASSTGAESPGTTRSDTAGAPCNCCPVRTGRPTPEQLWMCLKDWTIAWAVQHEGCGIPSQEAPPRPSVLRGFARRTTHSPIIHQPTNGLGTNMGGQAGDSGRQPRCRASHRHLRSQQHGTSSQNSETAAAQEAHAAADGQMEGGAEGEAQRSVHSWDRPGVAYTQRHREEVHERREPTHGAHSADLRTHLI